MAEQQEYGSEQSDFRNNTEEGYPPSEGTSFLDCEIVPGAHDRNVEAIESLHNAVQPIIRIRNSQPAEPQPMLIDPDTHDRNVAAIESLHNSVQALIRIRNSQPAEPQPMLKFQSIWVNLDRMFLKMSDTDVELLNLEFQCLCLKKIIKNQNC